MSESNLVQQVRVEASKIGWRLFRNNTGRLQDKKGRWVQFGLCVGSSDLIGWTDKGRFAAIECKTKTGAIRPEQINFIEAVLKAGGIGGIVRSLEDFKLLVDKYT